MIANVGIGFNAIMSQSIDPVWSQRMTLRDSNRKLKISKKTCLLGSSMTIASDYSPPFWYASTTVSVPPSCVPPVSTTSYDKYALTHVAIGRDVGEGRALIFYLARVFCAAAVQKNDSPIVAESGCVFWGDEL
ncbi:MAG: hypothetical protein JNL67_07000 [Planctomycetaceae bacterium]|nr:hypothetical protein [Planctomycetaceae bacterium]